MATHSIVLENAVDRGACRLECIGSQGQAWPGDWRIHRHEVFVIQNVASISVTLALVRDAGSGRSPPKTPESWSILA